MEPLSNTAKRKKRKTRKCLDEIRKRSRRTGQILFEKDNGKVCDHFSNYKNINNCLLTKNRLTLRMFPRAVRSETITRPALADLNQKPKPNSDELVKSTEDLNTMNSTRATLPDIIDTFDNNTEHFDNKKFQIFSNKSALEDSVNHEESVVKNLHSQEDELFVNFDLFNSMVSTEITDKSPDSIGAQSVSTNITTSNQSLHDDYGYNLYEEFMSEIPTYLKQNTTFIEDVMKKTKVFLQNLFIESCYQECEDNVSKCIKNNTGNKIYYTPREMIVHNPMDYIRLGHVHQQSLFLQSSKTVGPSRSSSTPHSPLIAPSSPAASPHTPLSVIVHDTPDYTYYPHRLN